VTAAILRPPDYDDRLLLLGSTKSGKTVAGCELLRQGGYRRWNAIDWKGDVFPDVDHLVVHDPPWEHPRAWKEDRVLYRPLRRELRTPKELDRVLRWLFERQQDQFDHKRRRPGPRRIAWVDEAFHLSRTGHTLALSDAATAGRALGLGLWVGSQRPRWIPVEVRSEAFLWLIFALQYLEDEREVVRYAKGQLALAQLEAGWRNHGFWALRRLEDPRTEQLVTTAQLYPPLRIPTPQEA
jgi:hypothetical protein